MRYFRYNQLRLQHAKYIYVKINMLKILYSYKISIVKIEK